MARTFRLNRRITLDLERILSVAAVEGGIRLTYVNGEQETVAPISRRDRDRFFDRWLAHRAGPATPRHAAR